jgi:competence protein ComEC
MPLFWVSISTLMGILLASWLGGNWQIWLLAGTGVAGLAFLFSRLPWARLHWGWQRLPALGLAPVVLGLGLALGGARYQAAQPVITPGSLPTFNGQGQFTLRGLVVGQPDVRDQAVYLDVEVEEIARSGHPAQPTQGMLRVRTTATGEDWAYGDEVRISGEPVDPPENADFSYRATLSRQHIYTYISIARVERLRSGLGNPVIAWIYRLQNLAVAQVNRLYPAPEAALLAGILLGMDNAIPDSIQQAFKVTGTAHIIAISGFKNPLSPKSMLRNHQQSIRA